MQFDRFLFPFDLKLNFSLGIDAVIKMKIDESFSLGRKGSNIYFCATDTGNVPIFFRHKMQRDLSD